MAIVLNSYLIFLSNTVTIAGAIDDKGERLFDNVSYSGKEDFAGLYRFYYPKMVNHAYQKINDAATAEDIVQDIFLNIYTSNVLAVDAKSYLFVALRNRIYDYWRKQLSHNKHIAIISKEQPAAADVTWNNVLSHEMEQQLLSHVEALPHQCRKVFILRREEQLSNKEIAERLGISVNTVEQHMRRAIQLLKGNADFTTCIIIAWLMM